MVVALVTSFITGCQEEHLARPNIVIFFTDDQGYGDVGCFGAEGYYTPHFDQLADQGVRFSDFYVAASVCTPSRAALLTGKYPKRVGLHEAVLFPYSGHGLSRDETTLPEMLKPLGYTTACIGKWHLGHLEQFMPKNHGFDYYYGVPYSNDMDNHFYKHNQFQSPPLPVYENETLVEEGPDQDQLTSMWTGAAVEFINSNKDKPFFIYVAHNMPHTPWHVSDNYRGSSQRGLYGDIIQELDWSMGEIMKALRDNGLDQNTLVLFTSDNGPVTRHQNGGTAGPLRGSKATTWEGGMRVPAIISWPEKIPQGVTCSLPVSTLDLLPTLATLCGGELTEDLITDGRDITEILLHPETDPGIPFELIYYSRDGKPEAIRQGDWKLHIAKRNWPSEKDGEFPVSLYNLRDDIGENNNLAGEYPDLVQQMMDDLNSSDKKVINEYPKSGSR